MSDAVIEVPLDLLENIASLRFPAHVDRCLQSLMDRNTEGELTQEGREELAALVQLAEGISLVRAKALLALGRTSAL